MKNDGKELHMWSNTKLYENNSRENMEIIFNKTE